MTVTAYEIGVSVIEMLCEGWAMRESAQRATVKAAGVTVSVVSCEKGFEAAQISESGRVVSESVEGYYGASDMIGKIISMIMRASSESPTVKITPEMIEAVAEK